MTERHTMGDCFYCEDPVLAAPGQAIKHRRIEGKEVPTHKRCRKLNKKK